MQVYLVWHVRHAAYLDGRPTDHVDGDGDLLINEEDGDDVKILGVYSAPELADARIERAKGEPGFEDEPDCFIVSPYTLDQDAWVDGFVSVEHEPSRPWFARLASRLRPR